jgi:hypothetical protein
LQRRIPSRSTRTREVSRASGSMRGAGGIARSSFLDLSAATTTTTTPSPSHDRCRHTPASLSSRLDRRSLFGGSSDSKGTRSVRCYDDFRQQLRQEVLPPLSRAFSFSRANRASLTSVRHHHGFPRRASSFCIGSRRVGGQPRGRARDCGPPPCSCDLSPVRRPRTHSGSTAPSRWRASSANMDYQIVAETPYWA